MSSALSLGIDFGTTNTVVALADASGPAHLVRFPAPERELFAFRSCLSFHAGDRPNDRAIAAGPWAIDAYVEDPAETRFIQSLKSSAASESFSETTILNRRYRFEDLLSTFLLKLRAYADAGMAELPSRVIVGRPVTFAGGAPSEPLALSRYETAFERMGFTEILYAYEPVGAAFFFARELDHDATVLVGDFGGGTSDFSIIRFEREAGEIRALPAGGPPRRDAPQPRHARDPRPGPRGRRAGEDRAAGGDLGRELRLPALPLSQPAEGSAVGG